MPAPTTLEAAPNTIVVVEKSFEYLMQRASGHGDALRVEVDHRALMEAAADSGFNAEDVLSIEFGGRENKPRISVAIDDEPRRVQHCLMVDCDTLLRTSEMAQHAIQNGVLYNLLKLAQDRHGSVPTEFRQRICQPFGQRMKRRAKIIGGVAASIAGTSEVLEVVAVNSPSLIKTVTAVTIGKMVYDRLSSPVLPMPRREDESLISGYPAFVRFTLDETES